MIHSETANSGGNGPAEMIMPVMAMITTAHPIRKPFHTDLLMHAVAEEGVKTKESRRKRRQILVIGNNTNGCTPLHEQVAYGVGFEIGRSGSVLVTGGLGGVMEAASRGASDAGGLSVGIIPQDDASLANPYCDIVIPTGMGLTRDFLNALSADGIVRVGGGSGTLSEVCAAYMHKKPMVAVRGLGGSVEQYIGRYLDHRENVKILGANTPKEAVQIVLDLIPA